MNDRFKFRIYDLEQKHYLRVIQDETTGAEGFAAFYGEYNNICKPMSFFLCHDIDRWVIEQCTGLKDKNGNLIYEGDKIKCGNGLFNTATVKYENGENFIDGIYPFNLYHDCGDECHCQLRDFPEYACEIIGNIHEQPDQKDE